MNKLPNEILAIIGSHLSVKDLQNFSFCYSEDISLNGFCYTSIFKYSKEIGLKYGSFISERELSAIIFKEQLKSYNCLSRIYIDNNGITCHVSEKINHVSNMFIKISNYDKPLSLTLIAILKDKNMILNDNNSYIVNFQNRIFGSTGSFNLHDLLNNQPTIVGYYCPEPNMYNSIGKIVENPVVSVRESFLRIDTEISVIEYSMDSQDIGKVRHDYVASRLRQSTDEELSILGVSGPEARLTPDCIDIQTKKVLELGTTKSFNNKSLLNDFESKKLKYDYILKPLECNTYYLIVGINQICTNLTLSQSMIDDLCGRLRVGFQIENQIRDTLGFDPFNNDRTSDSRIADAIFNSMSLDGIKEDKYFNIRSIIDSCRLPDDNDRKTMQQIVNLCVKNSMPPKKTSRTVLNEYLNRFDDRSTNRIKRITNLPLIQITNVSDHQEFSFQDSDLPPYLRALWDSSFVVTPSSPINVDDKFQDVINNTANYEPHKKMKESIFTCTFSDYDKIEAAKTGLSAKYLSDDPEIKEHSNESHKSFNPSTNTLDISDFLSSKFLCEKSNVNIIPAHLENLILNSKSISTNNLTQSSSEIWKTINDTNIMQYSYLMTYIMTELSYNYKHWTKRNQYIKRHLNYGISLIIRNAGGHLFVSMSFPKNCSRVFDSGRLGPMIYTTKTHYITDIASFNEPTMEHFLKMAPYISSIFIHLNSVFETEPGDVTTHVNNHINFIFLLYLNNKTDAEEIMTSQRYLFMKLLEDTTNDPYVFVDRLPEVLRSRFSVFLLNRTVELMDYYNNERIIKTPSQTNDGAVNYVYSNIKSLVDFGDLTLRQKINEFYYGYVVSKEKGRGSDRNFKILNKIIKEEYEFRDNVESSFNDGINFEKFKTNKTVIRYYNHIFKQRLSETIGKSYESTIQNDFYQELSFTNFIKLATLKASAKDHEQLIKIRNTDETKRDKIINDLKEENKSEFEKRPKVLEALMLLVKTYQNDTGKSVNHMMQLIPWCLDRLTKKGYFDSDIFPKPQHGGDREIHVLEISARIVQFTIELLSKVVCKYFASETITHPSTKEIFVKKHYKESEQSFKTFTVHSKSADASKWCQRHHTSHFASMLLSITPKCFHNFIIKSLSLWNFKRISFPLQMTATLLANRNTFTTTKSFIRFRDEFNNGTGIFTQSMGNKIEIKSGMMQGILHYTSSLYHTMIQEVSRLIILEMAEAKFNLRTVISIVQGSDDSGMLISIEGKSSKLNLIKSYMLLRFKEEISQYLCVYWNVCKSSIGTVDLIEYNSEWHVRHQVIKPTFRWISACMETSVVERFIDRIRIFNNVLTQCLEGGASTLECSVVQFNQCWMHYMLLGIHTNELGPKFAQLLISKPMIQYGFFPFDYDFCTALPGIDFQLYNLFMINKLRIPLRNEDDTLSYDFEGSDKKLIPRDLRTVKLKFGKLTIWKSLLSKISLGTLEDAVSKIEDDPLVLFGRHTSWEEEVPNLIIKIFSPGVKESLNNVSSALRMMAASSYMMTTPCVTVYQNGELKKSNLFSLLYHENINDYETIENANLSSIFPLHNEYEEFRQMISKMSSSNSTFKQQLKRHSKSKITIFEVTKRETPIIEMCKRKWFNLGKIALSSKQFDTAWSSSKLKYQFLRDTPLETAKVLGMTIVELKSYLEQLQNKSRTVVLQDTAAKSSSVQSTITRIYWPDVKIRSKHEDVEQTAQNLRRTLFSILTYWMSDTETTKHVTNLLQHNNHFKRCNFEDLPSKLQRLKIMSLWANGHSKSDLIEKIKYTKQGVLGYFSQIQLGWGHSKSGFGEWRGQVLGISCIIKMIGNATYSIELNHIRDSFILGPTLINLLSEFKIMNVCSNSPESNINLSGGSKIVTNVKGKGLYFPIIVNEKLNINIIKDIEEKPWSFDVKGTSLRLRISENNGSKTSSYTILSESISQRDWLSSQPATIENEDLDRWNKGIAGSINDMSKEIDSLIPDSRASTLKILKNIKDQRTSSGWNLLKLKTRILEQCTTKSIDHSKSIMNSEMTAETKREIDDFLMEMANENVNLSVSWADEVNEISETSIYDDLNLQSIELSPENLESVKYLCNELSTLYDSPDREIEVLDDWTKMSMSNKYFDNLKIICKAHYGCDFNELYQSVKSDENRIVSGFIGKIMTLLCNRYVHGSPIEDTMMDLISESSQHVKSVLSQNDLDDIDVEHLKRTIQELNKIPRIEGAVINAELEKIRFKYSKMLYMKENRGKISDFQEANFSDFISTVVDHVTENRKCRFWNYEGLNDSLKLSLLRIELNEFLQHQFKDEELITEHEYTSTIESIKQNVVSHYWIDTVAECYKVNIDIGLYKYTRPEFDEL